MRPLTHITLAATICCSAAIAYADQTTTPPPALKNLLAQGWGKEKPAEKSADVAPSAPVAKTTIVRSKPRFVVVPPAALPSRDLDNRVATSRSPKSLAELIQTRPKPAVLNQQSDAAAHNIDLTPTVNRLEVGRRVIDNISRNQEQATARPGVRSAESAGTTQMITVQIEPAQTKPAQTKPAQTKPAQTKPAPTEPIPTEPIQTEPVTTEEVVARALPEIDTPVNGVAKVAPPAPVDAVVAERDNLMVVDDERTKSHLPETEAFKSRRTGTNHPPGRETAYAERETKTTASEIGPPVLSDRLRRIASNSGFGPFPLARLEDNPASELQIEHTAPLRTASAHATRLRKLAQESLLKSQRRLQRQATHSAKKYATDALRSIVAMRDAEAGGNRHMIQLRIAFDAIRESKDFCGQFGDIDQIALKRMVAVHETDVLKGRDLDNVSGLEATESYLAVARTNLVLAAGGFSEASDALVLLGQIEKRNSEAGNTHGAVVAVSLQRAAIEIEPSNALGYRELGTTLLNQGLVDQAAWALNKSIQIHPTRSSYQRLLEASRRLGDAGTARVCLASLQDPRLPSEIPVQRLTTQQFAASYRPIPASAKPAKTTKSHSTEASKAHRSGTGFRSLLPFGRR